VRCQDSERLPKKFWGDTMGSVPWQSYPQVFDALAATVGKMFLDIRTIPGKSKGERLGVWAF